MNKPKMQVLFAAMLIAAVCLAGAAAAEGQASGNNIITVDEFQTFPLLPETEPEELQSVYDTGLLMSGDYTVLPEKYDLRDYGYVTPVRNQNPYGDCWAFGMIGAMESSILKNGLVTGTDATNLDLSELHLVYYITNRDGVTKTTYLEPFEENGDAYSYFRSWYKEDGSYNPGYLSFDPSAIYQVLSGIGVANEDTNPDLKYEKMDYYFVDGNKLEPETAVKYNSYYPKTTVNIKSTDTQDIKECIMKYGAGAIYYHVDDSSVYRIIGHPEGGKIVFDKFASDSYYQNEEKTYNHLVTVIGWDDNYPKENFANYKITGNTEEGEIIYEEIPRPTSNGAWLIKNSWGVIPKLGYDGYFWLSYEDPSIANPIFYDMVKANSYYDTIYQYDLGTNTSPLENEKEYDYSEEQKIATKNVFEAKSHEKITAVLFTTENTNIWYSVDILVNGSSVLREPLTGYLAYIGDYTILLPETENVEVKSGDKIEVIVEQSMNTPSSGTKLGAAVNCYWSISNDKTDGTEINKLSFITTGIPGRSYVKYQDDADWTDISTLPKVKIDEGTIHLENIYGYARIKLYTEDIKPATTSSSVTAFFGEKDGSDFTFMKAVVITKATLPGASSATVTNTSGNGWYTCNLSAEGFAGNGILYFQVPLDVIDIKGWTVNDVSMLGCTTTYLSNDDQYAYYSAIITKDGALTIDFEKDAAQKAVETKPVTVETPKTQEPIKTVETPVTTTPVTTEKPVTSAAAAKSPFPVLGILAGLGIAGLVALRRR